MIEAIGFGLSHIIETFGLIGLIIAVALAVVFLKGFDRISGRGPKQVSDGIKQADMVVRIPRPKVRNPRSVLGHLEKYNLRIPCPFCAEQILPHWTVCPFCKSQLKG
jgi:hypothetical protein